MPGDTVAAVRTAVSRLALLHLVEFLEFPARTMNPSATMDGSNPIFQIGASECCRENGADEKPPWKPIWVPRASPGDAAGREHLAKKEGQDALTIE